MAKARLTKQILFCTLVILSIFALFSCGEGGSKEILTKEELSANIADSEDLCADYVFSYLDRWDIPLFSTSKIKKVETLYKKHYYKPLPDTLEHARLTATHFVENFYDVTDLSDPHAVTEVLIRSYVETVGDDYSYYRTADEYEDYSSDMSGSFVGIGITVMKDSSTPSLFVTEVTGESAMEAGLLPEDKIIAVDGKTVAELGYTKAVAAVKGEEGTKVTLTINRAGEILTLVATRVKITENTVDYSINDGIAYVRIKGNFKSNTADQFYAAIEALEKAEVKGVIYDLRSNTGGYLHAVEDMLDRIAPKGQLLVSFSNGYDDSYYAARSNTFYRPTVILCNGLTASAGELFTAGVRDIGAIVGFPVCIVGTKTFGKGVMQRTYTLGDGAAVTMTVAYYNPPSGVNYDGVGITPDVEVILSDEGDNQLAAAEAKIREIVNNY